MLFEKVIQNRGKRVLSYIFFNFAGAAHGLSSILQMLMSVPGFLQTDPSAERDVRTTVDYLLSLQSLDGNFPCAADEIRFSTRRPDDELVHWCHGAPGMIFNFWFIIYFGHGSFRFLSTSTFVTSSELGDFYIFLKYFTLLNYSGIVYLMAKAYLMWQEERYLQSCIRCADVVWNKGLLKKGPGKLGIIKIKLLRVIIFFPK